GDGWTSCEDKRRHDVIECALGYGLNKWKLRCSEGRRDARLFYPDQSVAGTDHTALGDAICDSKSRTKIEFVQFARRLSESILAEKIQLLRLKIENSTLVVSIGRR